MHSKSYVFRAACGVLRKQHSGGTQLSSYDKAVLGDAPALYLAMRAGGKTEPDLTGHGAGGRYANGIAAAGMPNGDPAADFDGLTRYLRVPNRASMSVPTTVDLTWEAWIRPDTLDFPKENFTDHYTYFLGKCETYGSPATCEWAGRIYGKQSQNRPNRISGYIFNDTAKKGSGADWRPGSGVIRKNAWLQVVVEYTIRSSPPGCHGTAKYPGGINIWVNGMKWDDSGIHLPTGCMSQFKVHPKANTSPMDVGRLATDTYFKGAVGRVAVYNVLRKPRQIANHYFLMTGRHPAGTCVGDTCTFSP